MKKSEYTEEYLLSMPIRALRSVLRDEFNGTPRQGSKNTLIKMILDAQNGEGVPRSKRGRKPKNFVCDSGEDEGKCVGVVDLCPDGYGFLRYENYGNSKQDIFVPHFIIKQYGLRNGDLVRGECAKLREKEQPALQRIIELNGICVDKLDFKRPKFDDLVPCYPNEKITLETENASDDLSIRCIDLLCPIGKGQRGLIVAPPKTGKTTLLEKIACSIEENNPDIKVIVLLIDERPEEVTEFRKCVNSEVVYSTFDDSPEHHIKVAELVANRAKRLVESGNDVVVLLDSITKLTRAYNTCTPSSGRTLSGGIDPVSFALPKKFFGSARNVENGGSLTIIATALIETGSKMDEVIYEEFKGTGNMEIMLSGELSEQRVFPAIDLYKSGTRKEELLLSERELDCAYKVRRLLRESPRASESFLEMLGKTKTNSEFVSRFEEWLKLMK